MKNLKISFVFLVSNEAGIRIGALLDALDAANVWSEASVVNVQGDSILIHFSQVWWHRGSVIFLRCFNV